MIFHKKNVTMGKGVYRKAKPNLNQTTDQPQPNPTQSNQTAHQLPPEATYPKPDNTNYRVIQLNEIPKRICQEKLLYKKFLFKKI